MSSPIHGANGTATSSRASSTVAVNQRERINGWTCPWHPLQFIAWLFLIVFAISYFGVHVFYLPHEWRAAGFIIPGGFCVIHIIYHILALTIDPADRNIRGGTRKDKAFFDRHQHQHVIEDFHCYICQADVGSKSKHCSVCNKCVSDFDHHCKWLNNCVGGRNYRLFIGCIASAFVLAIIVFVVTLRVFIMCFISRDELKSLTDGEFKILTVPIKDDNAFIIFTAIVGGLLLLSIALLGHLLGFHIYLIYHKMSTYEFIVSSRDRTQHNTDVEAGISKSPPSRKVFKNKVKPEEERRESSENERIELTDNARSEGSEENLINEPTVKIINEVSSKAAAKQSRSSTSDPETSQEQPQGYDSPSKRASGVGQYSPRDITQSSSSEESLKEIPPTTPRVAIQPPSDVSRASTSMSQYAQHGSDVTSSPRPGPSRERSDDEDGEELVPSPRGKKPKKRSPNGGVSWETGARQTTVDASLHKKKKKKLKNRAPDNLPRLATPNRRRPLPPLQIENPEGESN